MWSDIRGDRVLLCITLTNPYPLYSSSRIPLYCRLDALFRSVQVNDEVMVDKEGITAMVWSVALLCWKASFE